MPYLCPECENPEPMGSEDGLVTHLARTHDFSRIEARKLVKATDVSVPVEDDPTDPRNHDFRDDLTEEEPDLLEHLVDLSHHLGRPPDSHDIRTNSGPDPEEYIDAFGSILGSQIQAGLHPIDPQEYNHTAEGNKKYSEWDLMTEIWRLYEMTGKVSIRTMKHGGNISTQTYQYRYGSWSAALERAGLSGPNPSIEASSDVTTKHYGNSQFQELRQKALERDNHECQRCGISAEEHRQDVGIGLSVHHIQDVDEFETPEDADTLDNLETLCSSCHGKEHPFSKQ